MMRTISLLSRTASQHQLLKIICAVIWIVALNGAYAYDYCKLQSCPGETHTSCKFSLGPAAKCSRDANKLAQDEKATILSLHNNLREQLAAGKVDGFLRALDMQTLEWDAELESIAQTWADQCVYKHDDCRNVERWPVGQNIAQTSRSDGFLSEIPKKVMLWWDEYKQYAYKDGTFKFSTATGHFTQMAWAETKRLGCGRSTYVDGKFTAEYLVCNYGPSGNVHGRKMYTAGTRAPNRACIGLVALSLFLLQFSI